MVSKTHAMDIKSPHIEKLKAVIAESVMRSMDSPKDFEYLYNTIRERTNEHVASDVGLCGRLPDREGIDTRRAEPFCGLSRLAHLCGRLLRCGGKQKFLPYRECYAERKRAIC